MYFNPKTTAMMYISSKLIVTRPLISMGTDVTHLTSESVKMTYVNLQTTGKFQV